MDDKKYENTSKSSVKLLFLTIKSGIAYISAVIAPECDKSGIVLGNYDMHESNVIILSFTLSKLGADFISKISLD